MALHRVRYFSAGSLGWTEKRFRPVADGAASIKHVVNLPAEAGAGHYYQDEQTLPW